MDPRTLLFINLVLPIGQVNSPDFFCFTPETVVDLANEYDKDINIPVPTYTTTVFLYHVAPSLTSSTQCLQYIDVYVYD
jgi:hypothetical protein